MTTGKGTESKKSRTKKAKNWKGKYNIIGNFLTKVIDLARSDKMRGSWHEQEGWDTLRWRNTVPGKRQEKKNKKRGRKSRQNLKAWSQQNEERSSWEQWEIQPWIGQCSQKEQVRKKSIISGRKGQVVVQRKTIEKDLEAEGGNPHRVW